MYIMSLKNYSKVLVALVAGALFMVSCDNSKGEFPGFDKTDSGLYYKFHVKSGDTLKPQIGDLVSTYMDYRTDDTIFNSTPKGQPFSLPLMECTYDGDVFTALSMMSAGDSATFMINADSFFINTVGAPRPEFLDSNSYFYLDIKVSEIKTQAQIDKDNMEKGREMAASEQSLIENYIASNNLTINQEPSGIYYTNTKKGKGKMAEAGSFANLIITARAIGAERDFINTNGEAFDYEVGTGQLGIGFETGLVMMKAGDKSTMIIPFNLGFGAQGMAQAGVAPYATLVYEVELIKISSREEVDAERKIAEDKAKAIGIVELKNYLKTNKVTAIPNASGLYYIETVAGSGKQAVAGKKVKVHYTGMLLNGNKFDSSLDRGQPFEFTLGQNQVIAGWDEGIALMKEGGKAKLIIPSDLGYGPRGAGASIPPNATLVFEVELLEVID